MMNPILYLLRATKDTKDFWNQHKVEKLIYQIIDLHLPVPISDPPIREVFIVHKKLTLCQMKTLFDHFYHV